MSKRIAVVNPDHTPFKAWTRRDWEKAVGEGKAGGPHGVIANCTLPDRDFDEVLVNAYEQAGGLPGF